MSPRTRNFPYIAVCVFLGFVSVVTVLFYYLRPGSDAALIMRRCTHGSRTPCYFREFRKLAATEGLERSLEILDDLGKLDPSAKQCHILAHGIGYGIFDAHPNDWKNLVGSLSHDGCREGVIHALIERGVGQSGGGSLTPARIDGICGTEPAMWCLHAIGHAVLVDGRGDMGKAISVCEALPGIFRQFLCSEGAFMEYNTGFGLAAHGMASADWLDWKSRLLRMASHCNTYAGYQQAACWEETAHAALDVYESRLPDVYRFCERAAWSEAADLCKSHATGIMLISLQPVRTLKSKAEFCGAYAGPKTEDISRCHGIMIETYLYDHPDRFDEAVSYCSSLHEDQKKACFERVGGMAGRSVHTSEIQKGCQTAPEIYRNSCAGSGMKTTKFPWEQ